MERDDLIQSNTFTPLREIASGAGVVFLGMIFGQLLEYGIRITIARFLGPADYGLINLGLTILLLLTAFSLCGLNIGITRYIAYFSAQNKRESIGSSLLASLKVILPLSLIFLILLLLLKNYLAFDIFRKKDLQAVLGIFAFALPFSVLGEFFYASLRGFKKASYAILSREIFRRIFSLVFILLFLVLGFEIRGATIGYLIGFIAFASISFYYQNYRTTNLLGPNIQSKQVRRELFLYSWPLIFSFILMQINSRAGTVFLGYFKNAEEIGFYTAALPIAQIISVFPSTILFMFLPVLSGLYAEKNYHDLKSIFRDATRWIFLPSSIVFLVFFFFPQPILCVLFGENFISAATPLQILASVFFINAMFGPVGTLLLSIGHTKKYFIGDVIGVLVNIALCLLLIPPLGAKGAAYAVLGSMITVNSIRLGFVYHYLKVHPFTLDYLKFFVPVAACSFFLHLGFHSYLRVNPLSIIPVALLFLLLSALSINLFKCLKPQDIGIVDVIERRLGRSLPLMRKFVSSASPKT